MQRCRKLARSASAGPSQVQEEADVASFCNTASHTLPDKRANLAVHCACVTPASTHRRHVHVHCDGLGGTVAIAVADGGAEGLGLGHCTANGSR